MAELTGRDIDNENQADDAFGRKLDELRRMLPPPTSRTRLNNFEAWHLAVPVHRSEGHPGCWKVGQLPRRTTYLMKRASTEGRLTLYMGFVRHAADGKTQRIAPLLTALCRYDPKVDEVRMTEGPQPNRDLIDLLVRQGVRFDVSTLPATLEKCEYAHLEGSDRLAPSPWVAERTRQSTYLDWARYPALLRNPLLRLFLKQDEGGDDQMALAIGGCLQHGVASSTRPFGNDPASEVPTDVGPSERQTGAGLAPAAPADGRFAIPLDPDQQKALELCLANTATVIEGPPGTGKSRLIAALAVALARAGQRTIVTSTERSAIEAARSKIPHEITAQNLTIADLDDLAAERPPEVGVPDYDFVIIDEASRMPLQEAATALGRARSAVIIGDDRQMRPSVSGVTLLDRARQIDLPRSRLSFHYRSLERSLIMPSNLISYGMTLNTVPSPEIMPSNGLRLADTFGTCEASAGRMENRAEAEAIVAELAQMSGKPQGGTTSIGVVTGNSAQTALIRRMVLSHPQRAAIRELGSKTKDRLRIDSYADVQGEERDTMLVSTVYDAHPDRRYGIFDTSEGTACLNVMLSRARKNMTVFMSVSVNQVSPKPNRPGYALLLGAREIMRVAADAETRQMASPAHNEIARRLNMKADHLGVVIGLRFKDDTAYRIGLVPHSNDKSETHWSMIELQLKAMGWITLEAKEERCTRMMGSVVEEIRTALHGLVS